MRLFSMSSGASKQKRSAKQSSNAKQISKRLILLIDFMDNFSNPKHSAFLFYERVFHRFGASVSARDAHSVHASTLDHPPTLDLNFGQSNFDLRVCGSSPG